MTGLIKFNRNFYKNENGNTLWYQIYYWIKTNKYIPIYSNGKNIFYLFLKEEFYIYQNFLLV